MPLKRVYNRTRPQSSKVFKKLTGGSNGKTTLSKGEKMKTTRTIWLVAAVIFAAGFNASAGFTEAVDVYEVTTGGTIDWAHTYDHSEDPIASATLTIVTDDVDGAGDTQSGFTDGEQDRVYLIEDGVGTEHDLGLLNDLGYYSDFNYDSGPGNTPHPDHVTSTTFVLDPSWIGNGFTVEVRVEDYWEVEIETSTLNITSVPEPTTMVLLGLGGLILRKHRKV
jgi:hypothetical protein